MPSGTFSNPGKCTKHWKTAPTAAIIATRACFISARRNVRKPSSSPTLLKPNGSKKPKGAVTPTSSAGLNGGGGGGAWGSASTASSQQPLTLIFQPFLPVSQQLS